IKGGLKTTVACVFHVVGPVPEEAAFHVRVTGPRTTEGEHLPVGGDYPLGRWREGEYIVDGIAIITKTSDPDGTYHIELGYSEGGDPIAAAGEGLMVTGDGFVVVGSYQLSRAR